MSRVDTAPDCRRAVSTITTERVREIAAVLLAAEAVGIAQWCVETAAEYAKARVQFGRPIGQFQGVKHRCADMLARTELARAAVWDAARAARESDNGERVAIAAGAALAFEAAFANGKDCVQTLGGIGFTWEHDAHIYLRRAMTLHQLVGDTGRVAHRARHARRWPAAAARSAPISPPKPRRCARRCARSSPRSRSSRPTSSATRLVDEGYITPSWPRPWGRDADALELLVIEEEFRAAKVARPGIMVGAWALPNLIVYGTQDQQDRWILPTLRGEIIWCQLFSEPGAGSDLASLSTRARRASTAAGC